MNNLKINQCNLNEQINSNRTYSNNEVLNLLTNNLSRYRNNILRLYELVDQKSKLLINQSKLTKAEIDVLKNQILTICQEIIDYEEINLENEFDQVEQFHIINLYINEIIKPEIIAKYLKIDEEELVNMAQNFEKMDFSRVQELNLIQKIKCESFLEPLWEKLPILSDNSQMKDSSSNNLDLYLELLTRL